MAVPRINTVMFDCLDLALADFWKGLLAVGERHRSGPYVWLEPQRQGGYSLAFQQVESTTPGKNKLHLDGAAEDLSAVTARVEKLGGSFVENHVVEDFTWNVYADPEGNLFCLGHSLTET